MKLTLVAGARPNFIKIAPIICAIDKARNAGNNIHFRLIHTGQHYDDALSLSFFKDLNIPQPDNNLGAGSGSQAEQTAAIMIGFEKELISNPPDMVIVVGDVNSTLACSIVAKKLQVKVAHVEAGIRSGDMTMPEEINRIVTDSICDYFFTTTPEAGGNLIKKGVSSEKIFFVGNTMIDCLISNMERISRPAIMEQYALKDGAYLVLTLHRPSNVDDPLKLAEILDSIVVASKGMPIIFPVHPRTLKTIQKIDVPVQIIQIGPMRYIEFVYLIKNARGTVTDSGGIQEETTFLQIPCITLRNNTERPETVALGTNELVGSDKSEITRAVGKLIIGDWKTGSIPALWDGKTSERIINKLINIYT